MERDSYKRLRLKIIGATLGFSFVPLALMAITFYAKLESTYFNKVNANLRNLAENKKETIDLFLNERISQLTTLAFTESFADLSREDYLEKVFSVIQIHSKSFIDLGVIDESGRSVAYCGPYQLIDLNYSKERWFQEAMAKGLYVSDVFLGFRKYPHFIIAVTRREGDKSWILRATIDSDIFDSMVRNVDLGARGDAFIINREGVLQTKPRNGQAVLEKIDFPVYQEFAGTRLKEMTVNGAQGLYALTWLNKKGWLLVLRDDPKEEFLPVLSARRLLLAAIGCAALLIITGAVIIANAMVSEVVKAEREKAALDANLTQQSKMAALGKMAAGVAHEVNNPLAIIMEMAGWMRDLLSEEEMKESENYKEFENALTKIEFHVRRAKDVTHRLLGFARRMEPLQEDVNVNMLLDQTRSFLENEANFREIAIVSDYQKDLPRITSDTAQLQQVFLNIIDNAIDAVGKDGTITISTRHLAEQGKVAVSIKDSGPGIPKDVLERLFDPFFTTKRVGEGTGLGLTISYSIIEKLGGEIHVESREGEGATFNILLPDK